MELLERGPVGEQMTNTPEKAHELVERGRREVANGSFACARATFGEAATLGAVEAYVELADLECREGNRAQAQTHLDQAEIVASATRDPLAHVIISSAYQLMLGSGDLHAQKSAAVAQLRRAAELGLASAQATLAHWYRFGLNGVAADAASFLHWVELAVSGGDPLATCELADYLIKQKEPLPDDLARNVRLLASEYEEARRLLSKLPG